MDWHVLHVHPRCEKKIGEYCGLLGLSNYLPLRSETKIYQRRRVTVEKPVFPGYFFASFDPEGRLRLLQTNLVVRVLEVPRQRQFLHELAQIRKALGADPTLGACEALRAGRHVRITAGPFCGVEGVVATLKANTRVLLNVEMIGQAVAVEVERAMVEVID